jgi:hypothetical protein
MSCMLDLTDFLELSDSRFDKSSLGEKEVFEG